MGKVWGREPALFLTAVHALLAVAIGFGFDITTEQFALIETAIAAVVGFVIRSQVTPTGDK